MSKKKTITPFYQLLVLWQVTNILLILFYRRYKNCGLLYSAGVHFLRRRLSLVRFHHAYSRMLAAFGKNCPAQVGIGQKTQSGVIESNQTRRSCAR